MIQSCLSLNYQAADSQYCIALPGAISKGCKTCIRYKFLAPADKVHELSGGRVVHTSSLNCGTLDLTHCRLSNATMVLASMVILVTIGYFGLYSYFIARRMLELRQLPHQDHKVNNLFVRMQVSEITSASRELLLCKNNRPSSFVVHDMDMRLMSLAANH